MNLKDLEYFNTLARLKHFGHAANYCGVSQPALSIQIKKLETELKVTLFERSKKSLVLTPEGAEVLQHAQKTLQAADDLRACAKGFSDPYQGQLIIGAFPTLAPYLFPKILDPLHESYPDMKFYIIEEKTAVLLEQLETGKIDAAFIALPHEDPRLEQELIFEEDFLLAVSAKSPINNSTQIKPDKLQDKDLMLLDEGHCFRDQALEFCSQNNINETFDFRASGLETLREMVAADLGMTLMPQCACSENPKLRYINFAEPRPRRQIGLMWRKNSPKKEIFTEIADELKGILKG